MHISIPRESGMHRAAIEVEAESVSYVVCRALGADEPFTFVDVGAWAGRDPSRVVNTARQVLRTADAILTGIELTLGVDLRENPLVTTVAALPAAAKEREWRITPGTPDETIVEHLRGGPLDWERLAAALRTEERYGRDLAGKPGTQAVALAAAGTSADATVAVLRAQGVEDRRISSHLTLSLVDSLGMLGPIYHPDDVARALGSGRSITGGVLNDRTYAATSPDGPGRARRRMVMDEWTSRTRPAMRPEDPGRHPLPPSPAL